MKTVTRGLFLLLSLLGCGVEDTQTPPESVTEVDSEPSDSGSVDSEPSDSEDTEDTEDTQPIDNDGDGFTADEDCDDADANVNPTASEVCDSVDNNCNDTVDEPAVSLGSLMTFPLELERSAMLGSFGLSDTDEAVAQEVCNQNFGMAAVMTDGTTTWTYPDWATALSDAAADMPSATGDITLLLCDGVFVGTKITSLAHNLNIIGSGEDLVVISSREGRALNFEGIESPPVAVQLMGLTIAHNNSDESRGAGVSNTGVVMIMTRVKISNNSTEGHGAGISVNGGTVYCYECTLSGNTATGDADGSASYFRWRDGIAVDDPTLYLRASAVYGNVGGQSALYLYADEGDGGMDFESTYFCNPGNADLLVTDGGLTQSYTALTEDTHDGELDGIVSGSCDSAGCVFH